AVVLALEALGKAQPLRSFAFAAAIPTPTLTPTRGFENDFACFAITNLDGIDNAGALVGGDDEAIHQSKHRFGKVDIEQRLRGRELEDLAVLKEAVEAAFAEIEEARLNRVGGQIRLGRLFLRARLPGAFVFRSRRCRNVRLNRKEHMQASAVAQSKQAAGDFVHRIFFHFLAALQAVSASDAGEE